MLGIVSTAGQMLMTHSYRFLTPQIANVLGRSIILWAALLDYIFTGRIPGLLEGVGYALAIAGMVLIQAEMSEKVRPEEMNKHVRISADIDQHTVWIKEYFDLGIAGIFLHNVGRNQEEFIKIFGKKVLPQFQQ